MIKWKFGRWTITWTGFKPEFYIIVGNKVYGYKREDKS